jgi:hypothetical protein
MTHAATDAPLLGCWGADLFPERTKASDVFISEKFDDAMDSMSDSAKKKLVEALTAVVKERRLCAQLLSKPYERGATPNAISALAYAQKPSWW